YLSRMVRLHRCAGHATESPDGAVMLDAALLARRPRRTVRRRMGAFAAGLTAVATAVVGVPAAVADPGQNGPGQPPSHESGLFDSRYQSLAERVPDRGYAPTSLTGYYGAMYTRDSSVNALALLLGGDDTDARAILRYIFRYSAAAGAPRMPHRIHQESDTPA